MNINLWKVTSLGLAGAFALTVGAHGIQQADAAKQPRMEAAREKLIEAKRQLEFATPNKSGHRIKAIAALDAALTEVKLGIEAGEENAEEPKPGAARVVVEIKPKEKDEPFKPHTEPVKNPK